MKIKTLFVEFGSVFAVTLVTAALVTFLWNLIGHGKIAVDWYPTIRFAIMFGIVLTFLKSRDAQK